MPTDTNGIFRVSEPTLFGNELRYVTEAVLSGEISGKGEHVGLFEEEFKNAIGSAHAIAVCNGSMALYIALQAIGIGPGDEVIVPTFTMAAPALAVILLGAKCKWVDCKKDGTINPDYIEAKITKKTKAIIPVHIYGVPCDMGPILKLAKKHNLKVIEDASEAHGATYMGSNVGLIGDIGIFSMYANKIVTCGEGGMIVTNDKDLAEKCKLYREYGMTGEYIHQVPALNARISNLAAAVGLAQLEIFGMLVLGRLTLAKAYNKHLAEKVITPELKPGHVNWMYGIRVKNRDKVRERLAEVGIETRPYFVPMHQQPFNKSWDTKTLYPISEILSEQGLYLPSSSHLTFEEIEHISNEVIKAVESFA